MLKKKNKIFKPCEWKVMLKPVYTKTRRASPNHNICKKLHFKKRLFERYGIILSGLELKNIIINIQNNRCAHLGIGSVNNTVKKIVKIQDRYIPVVYDKKNRILVTALPQELNMVSSILNWEGQIDV